MTGRTTNHKGRRFRRRGERGAVAVEAAIILPILIFVLFGVLEFGLFYTSNHSVNEATRAGARVASTLARNPQYTDAAKDAVESSLGSGVNRARIKYLTLFKANPATGMPVDGDYKTCNTCYRFTWTGNDFSQVSGPAWAPTDQKACGTLNETDYIGVYLEVDHEFFTGFFDDKVIREVTIMRLEPATGAAACF